MSLSAQAGANIANYVQVGTAETGIIVETFGKSQSATNTDDVVSPTNGETVLFGVHHNGRTEVSIAGVTLSGGIMATNIGNTYSLATSLAIAGGSSNGTFVILGFDINKDNAGGKFQRATITGTKLPF